MSDGKDYEIFVQNLQQALLNSEIHAKQKNINIERNKKIIDNSGSEREFDLYWEYELAGVTYKTVIECKDYMTRVSIDKIDALIGKIRDIPDLKPIFATKIGYQKGAEQKAKLNRIDLFIVREQRDNDWEDKNGNPFIREVNINVHALLCPRITNFTPYIDNDWVKKNTKLSAGDSIALSGMNNEIFIEDVANSETYSLHSLAFRMHSKSNGQYGNFNHKETFEDAYLISNGLRLKMTSYDIDYCVSSPVENTINIDFSRELIGVIEYLHKKSITAIYKNKIIKNWR